jgi:Protein of unknown function (DUF3619)
MTDDRDFAKKIVTYLDRGAADLKAGTAYKLQLARKAALDRLGDAARQSSPQWALAGAGAATIGGGRRYRLGAGLGLALLLAIGGIFGYQQWQAWQQLRDIADTDMAILSSDLPIDAYLDRGFQNWLKRVSDDD